MEHGTEGVEGPYEYITQTLRRGRQGRRLKSLFMQEQKKSKAKGEGGSTRSRCEKNRTCSGAGPSSEQEKKILKRVEKCAGIALLERRTAP